MIRSFIISMSCHLAIVIGFLVLAVLEPPIQPVTMMVNIDDFFGGGGDGNPIAPGAPGESNPAPAPTAVPIETPAPPEPTAPEPTVAPTREPAPEVTPAPEPASTPAPEPVATPEPPDPNEIIAPAKETPKPEATPIKIAKTNNLKEKPKDKKKTDIVEKDPALATPTPAPTPIGTPKKIPSAPVAPPKVPISPVNQNLRPISTPGVTQGPTTIPTLQNVGIQDVTGTSGVNGTGPLGIGHGPATPTYYGMVLGRIKSNFSVPFNRPVICKVRLTIMRDGKLVNPTILQSTTDPTLDSYAIQAIKKTDKVQPFYASDNEPSRDVIVIFTYEKE